MIVRFKSYNQASRGLANLKTALIHLDHNAYAYDAGHNMVGGLRPQGNLVINWGTSRNWNLIGRDGNAIAFAHRQLNRPEAVNIAANKLLAFRAFSNTGVPTVDWTEDPEVAAQWQGQLFTVVQRQILNGHSGEGIRIVEPNEPLSQAPLYTKYKKKKHEFRVHVFNGRVIDIQQKRIQIVEGLPQQAPDMAMHVQPHHKVRNHQNGWVYCRDGLDLNIERTGQIGQIAIRAVTALGLDFGAVDIIFNEREGNFYVLEVNTAVGLQGTTAEKYAAAIDRYIREEL